MTTTRRYLCLLKKRRRKPKKLRRKAKRRILSKKDGLLYKLKRAEVKVKNFWLQVDINSEKRFGVTDRDRHWRVTEHHFCSEYMLSWPDFKFETTTIHYWNFFSGQAKRNTFTSWKLMLKIESAESALNKIKDEIEQVNQEFKSIVEWSENE